MKKLLATTLCLASVWIISFKAIPALYPGIDTLTDYQSIQINAIEDNNFEEIINFFEPPSSDENPVVLNHGDDIEKWIKDNL